MSNDTRATRPFDLASFQAGSDVHVSVNMADFVNTGVIVFQPLTTDSPPRRCRVGAQGAFTVGHGCLPTGPRRALHRALASRFTERAHCCMSASPLTPR